MTTRLTLHLGAHKTASTHLQGLLARNSSVIGKNGVRFFGPGKMRGTITNLVPAAASGKHPDADVSLSHALDNLIGEHEGKRIILSDENLIGSPRDIYTMGAIYPQAYSQLSALRSAIGDRPVEKIFICLRNYSGYIPSSYCEMIRHYDFITFHEYVKSLNYLESYWMNLVKSVQEIFQNSEIVLWDFNNYVNVLEEVVNRIAGGGVFSEMDVDGDVARPSQSAKAIEVRAALQSVISGEEIKRIGNKIDNEFPKNEKYHGFKPYSSIEESYLEYKYKKEVDDIISKLQVTFIQ